MRRALVRWLRRPSRVPRVLRGALALVLGCGALLLLAAPAAPQGASASRGRAAPDKFPQPPGPGDPTARFPSSPALVAEGRTLYAQSCSSCHGVALQGRVGVAPSLIGVGAGPVDFYLSTGRMPLENPRDEPERSKPLFSRAQIDSLIAFVSSYGGPAAPAVDPARGSLAFGFHEFTLNCAGCHQIVARGGMTVGAQVPNLQQATPQQIAEAVRMGPYLMPRFGAKQIDQHALDSIARYVLWSRSPSDRGGWGIYNIGPVPEGAIAWFLALASLILVARLIGERTT